MSAFVDLETLAPPREPDQPPPGFHVVDGRMLSFPKPHVLQMWDRASRRVVEIGPTDLDIDDRDFAGDIVWIRAGSSARPRPVEGFEVWDLTPPRKRTEILGPFRYAKALRGDGKVMATVSPAGAIELWGADGGPVKILFPEEVPTGLPTDLVWQPGGTLLAFGDDRGEVEVWDPEHDRRVVLPSRCVGSDSSLITWSADGKYVVLYRVDRFGAICVYDASTWREISGDRIYGAPGIYTFPFKLDVILSPKEDRAVGATGPVFSSWYSPGIPSLFLWDIPSAKIVAPLRDTPSVRAHAFSLDGAILGVVGNDRHVRVYSAKDGTLLRTFPHTLDEEKDYYCILPAASHKFLTGCPGGQSIGLWDAKTGYGDPHFFGIHGFSPRTPLRSPPTNRPRP